MFKYGEENKAIARNRSGITYRDEKRPSSNSTSLYLFLLLGIILVTNVNAASSIQDEFTETSCFKMINGKTNCMSTIYSQPQFYLEETNYMVFDNRSGTWVNATTHEWKEITQRVRFWFNNANTTFTITDGEEILTLTPYVVTASGARRSFDWLRDNFPQFRPNIQIDKRKSNWKWGFNATIPSNLSIPQSLGFVIEGCDRGCGYGNGTLYFMGKELDLRPMHRDGWRFTLRNATALEFTNDRQFGNRSIVIDPYVQLNSNTTGSQGRSIRRLTNGTYEQLPPSTSIPVGFGTSGVGACNGELAEIGYCKGYLTFNISQIPKNVQINAINLTIQLDGGTQDTGGEMQYVFTRASPFYNNASNASNFFEFWEIGNTVNYSTALQFQGNSFTEYNITLADDANDPAAYDFRKAGNNTNGVFIGNFTIGIMANMSILGGTDLFNTKSPTAGADAPYLSVNWTSDAPQIQFVNPTPANGALTTSPLYVNVTTSTSLNHSAWIDFNRSLLSWISFDSCNATSCLSNASWGGHAFNPVTGGTVNQTQARRGLGDRINGTLGERYIISMNNLSFNPSSNWTMTMWINTGVSGIISQRFFEFVLSASDAAQCMYRSNAVIWCVYWKGGQWYNFTSGGSLSANTWYHVGLTWDGTNTSLYLDGGKKIGVGSPGAAPYNVAGNMSIGGQGSPTGGITLGQGGTAILDEFMFFNRTLDAQEINATFEAGMHMLFKNFTDLNTSLPYSMRACAIDEAGGTNCTETRTTITTAPAVNVTLISPPDTSAFLNLRAMNFTASAITNAGTLKNATLWINSTGAFVANATNTTGQANGSSFQFFNIPINTSAFLWNVLVCNTNDVCAFATGNFTFANKDQNPSVTLVSPSDQSTFGNGTLMNFTASATNVNITLKNATLFGNFSGVWQANVTNTSVLASGSLYSFFNIPLNATNSYIWNVYVCDSNNNCAFAPGNFTLRVSLPSQSVSSTNDIGFVAFFMILGVLFFIAGWERDDYVLKIIACSLFIISGLLVAGQGFSYTHYYQPNQNASTCIQSSNVSSFPPYNVTNLNTTCSYTNNGNNFVTTQNVEMKDKGIGMLSLLFGLAILLEACFSFYENNVRRKKTDADED